MSKKQPGVWEGFKAFLMRGDVIDLAVAVVIGAAFTNIVNSVVKGVVNPLVWVRSAHRTSTATAPAFKPHCTGTGDTATGIRIMWGSVLGAAAGLRDHRGRRLLPDGPADVVEVPGPAGGPAEGGGSQEVIEVSELEVLKEIRDALLAQRGSGNSQN